MAQHDANSCSRCAATACISDADRAFFRCWLSISKVLIDASKFSICFGVISIADIDECVALSKVFYSMC